MEIRGGTTIRNALRRAIQSIRDLPLQVKGQVVVAIPLSGLLLVVAAFYLAQRENQAAERWVSHTLETRAQIRMVHTQVEEAETGVLGYLITRDPAWLQPYHDARRTLPGVLNRLVEMVGDDPSELARARHVRELVMQRLRDSGSLPERVPAQSGPHPDLVNSRSSLLAIRRELGEMSGEENRLLEARQARARAVSTRGYAAVVAGVLFAPAGAILAMLLFTEGISRRMEVLEGNARRLAQGEPIAWMRSGTDEIGRLEQSVAAAARLLAEREQALRRAAAELERRVEERTAEMARSREELADANQRLQAVIDASPLAIMGLDLKGRVTSWNRAAEQIFGYQAEEVLDQPLPTIPDPETEESRARLSARARGQVLRAVETRRRRKDGRLVDARLWTAPLRNAAGEITGEIAIVADFTEQHRLEQQFTQAQKMEAIGRLAGGAAHDFNNVITVIAGYGQMLVEGVKDDPALSDAAEEVMRAADRAAALAGQLLVFSRRQTIQPKALDLNELVANVQRMLVRVLGEDIELKTVLSPKLGAVRADAGQLEQVIVNLALNSRDAMPGGGKLMIETADVALDENYARIHSLPPGPYVLLAVSDTGEGMTGEVQSHIFEPFFTTKERGKGTGLGLSTVYGIVKQHGGDIWVYSEPGRGTTFKIYLPRMVAAAAARTPEGAPPPAPQGTETVLVVEDEAVVRKLIHGVLEGQGYTVLEAESGEKALEICASYSENIDLLVTDVVMPKMSGRDLAEALGLLRPETKVLFLSGYTDQAVVDHGVLEDGMEFLQKPFMPDVLARRVRQVLDRRRGQSG